MKDAIIFLDIDGVIQLSKDRLDRRPHDEMKAFQAKLAKEKDPDYAYLDVYDVDALRDWSPEAVESLRTICTEANADVVISSSWKDDRTIRDLLLLFAIQGLDRFVAGATYPLERVYGLMVEGKGIDSDKWRGPSRTDEIMAYLQTQAWKVHHMVILDDNDWGYQSEWFPGHFFKIPSYDGLQKKHIPDILKILATKMPDWHRRKLGGELKKKDTTNPQ